MKTCRVCDAQLDLASFLPDFFCQTAQPQQESRDMSQSQCLTKLRGTCVNCQRCPKHCFHERGCCLGFHRESCLTCSGAVVYVRGRPMSSADADEKKYILRLKKFSKYKAFQNVKCRLAGFFSKVGTQKRWPKPGTWLKGDFGLMTSNQGKTLFPSAVWGTNQSLQLRGQF
jgi:hypothetical protein